jgi:L-ascorbate metabolism protein UlaG (beta-lactamase superfamily)
MEHKLPITPIAHATIVLHLGGQVIYTDPVGGGDAFKNQPSPNLILVTDIHGDHCNPATLKAVAKEDTVIVVPQAVQDILPEGISGTIVVMANGEKGTQKGVEIE